MKIKRIVTVVMIGAAAMLAGCSSQADVASENLSMAADNFEIPRRIVFYNGITGDYMLEVIGYCSLGNNDAPGKLTVTCKVTGSDGKPAYRKDFLGLSDNVTYFAEQLEPVSVSTGQYRVVFRPSEIMPDVHVGNN